MRMGTSIPPQAATTGSKALRGEEEFADQDLPFDFQTDGEEEDSHQRIVDQGHEGHIPSVDVKEVDVSELQNDLFGKKGIVGFA